MGKANTKRENCSRIYCGELLKMNVAVVLNFMNFNQTIDCVKNLLDKIDKIIIVDNNSSNDSYNVLRKKFIYEPTVFVIKQDSNKGYASGNNVGLKYAERKFGVSKSTHIYIVNPDSYIDSETVTSISKFIDDKSGVGAVTALINGSSKSAWHHMNKVSGFIFNSWILRWFLLHFNVREGGIYKIKNKDFIRVDAVVGAFFVIRQDVFKEVGYFDEGTFLYFEEEALYARLNKKKYSNFLLTTESFRHVGRTSTTFSKISFKKINDASRLYILKKYYNAGSIYVGILKTVNRIDNFLLEILHRG